MSGVSAESKRWHIALVDMIRSPVNGDSHSILDADDIGGIGWMGVLAGDTDEAENLITNCLAEIGLSVRSFDDCQELVDIESFEEFDEHLAENILCRPEDDPPVVWGTLHTYAAEGEA